MTTPDTDPTEVKSEIKFSKLSNGDFRLECQQLIVRPITDVFDFFSDAFQLEKITPDSLQFCVLTPPPIDIQAGTVIDYRLKLRGIPIRWCSLIAEWQPPYRFVDQQLKGPYLKWHHEHLFHSVAEGTLCRDVVDYRVPGGALVNRLFVQSELTRIFAYRQRRLEALLI